MLWEWELPEQILATLLSFHSCIIRMVNLLSRYLLFFIQQLICYMEKCLAVSFISFVRDLFLFCCFHFVFGITVSQNYLQHFSFTKQLYEALCSPHFISVIFSVHLLCSCMNFTDSSLFWSGLAHFYCAVSCGVPWRNQQHIRLAVSVPLRLVDLCYVSGWYNCFQKYEDREHFSVKVSCDCDYVLLTVPFYLVGYIASVPLDCVLLDNRCMTNSCSCLLLICQLRSQLITSWRAIYRNLSGYSN